MSTSSKTKFLVGAIVVLLLTNIAVLVYFLKMDKGPGKKNPREQGMIDFLKKDIGFSDQQMQLFDTLSKEHKQKSKAAMEQVRSSRQELFRELGQQGFADSTMSSVETRSTQLQSQMELNMLAHFKKIRQLCTDQQRPKFDSLFYTLWNKKPEKKEK